MEELAEADMGAAGYAAAANTYGYGDANQGDQRWAAENQAAGRHYATDNVKEGQPTGGSMGAGSSDSAEAARERASAAGRTGNQPNQPNG